MLSKDFIYLNQKFDSMEDFFEFLEAELIKEGYVSEGFAQQLLEREQNYPTGLPTDPGVALPHTDGSLVNKDLIVVTSLDEPMSFGEMGGEDDSVIDSEIIITLVIGNGENHLNQLQKTISFIQDSENLSTIKSAQDTTEVYQVLKEKIG